MMAAEANPLSMLSSLKGKDKADPRLPLLSDERNLDNDYGSTSQDGVHPSEAVVAGSRPHWKSYLLTGTLTFVTILFVIAFAIVLLADSYAAPALRNIKEALSSGTTKSGIFWQSATIVRGPDNIKVLGLEKNDQEVLEANVTMTMRIVVDTDFIMGFRDVGDNTWFKRKWKQVGRWGVRRLGTVTAVMDNLEIYPSNTSLSANSLVVVKLHEPISIPLRPGLTELDHAHPPSLQTISVAFSTYPSPNSTLISEFVEQTWLAGFASIKVHASNFNVHGGQPNNVAATWWRVRLWRQWIKYSVVDVFSLLRVKIPQIKFPGQPGTDLPKLSELLALESFKLTSESNAEAPMTFGKQSTTLGALNVSPSISIIALASLPHPFPSLASKFDLGKNLANLPFIVSLPTLANEHQSVKPVALPVVAVTVSPEFNATHIRINVLGHVLPLSDAGGLSDAISGFVSNYLSYRPSPIVISSPLYSSLEINTDFPPPSHKLELLRDVRITNMKINPRLGLSKNIASDIGLMEILASANVYARVVLPDGVDIDVTVKRVWIDCLVFDGPVSDDFASNSHAFPSSFTHTVEKLDEPPVPQPLPLPSPLPPRAFARLTPRSWLNTTSSSDPIQQATSIAEGRSVYVKADVVNVPLEVLPGRQSELSRFVTKVLFSSGPVTAGLQGFAAVGVTVPGLTGSSSGSPGVEGSELILTGVPFEGNVNVGGH